LGRDLKPYIEDQKLVTAVAVGNQQAFSTIVKKYETMIAKVAIGMLGNKADADDVGQETFIRFYRSAKQFKGDSSLGTYLSRIAINLSLNELKKRKSQRWLSFEDKYNSHPKTEDAFKQADTAELVNKALEQLEPEFRSVVVLRMMQGFSTKETAQILDLPLGTVLSRLSRAQEKLREIIIRLEK
jgi:RNA polymerase sigma-70 factor (ECF subfamily)